MVMVNILQINSAMAVTQYIKSLGYVAIYTQVILSVIVLHFDEFYGEILPLLRETKDH